ncbi:MAG TPA: hypothetical protein VGQ20_18140 [Acidimicrobiales bacterium]|jgi:hypothetical protein|nr:hypothetical protein [Acidimicrobiales bacterium]
MTATTTGRGGAAAGGVRTWTAVFAGIALWLIHLTAASALAVTVCDHPATEWLIHALTVVTAAATGLAVHRSWLLTRAAGDADEEQAEPAGRARFLGRFGIITGVASIVLIVAEGAYVPFLAGCR